MTAVFSRTVAQILTILLILTTATVHGQSTDSIKAQIIGKWLLVKHTLLENKKTVDKLTSDTKNIFEFKKDGTYKNTSTNKFGTVITVGKWKVSADKKAIDTYDNKFLPPWDKNAICADHPLNIIKLNKFEFVTNECLYSESPAGTSYYKKQ